MYSLEKVDLGQLLIIAARQSFVSDVEKGDATLLAIGLEIKRRLTHATAEGYQDGYNAGYANGFTDGTHDAGR